MINIVPLNGATDRDIGIEDLTLPTLLSMKELCKYLGLGRTTVTYMLQQGEIPHMKIKGRIRVFATDLRDYLNKQYSKHEATDDTNSCQMHTKTNNS